MQGEHGHAHQEPARESLPDPVEVVGTIAPKRRSVPFVLAGLVLPVSLVLYVSSLFMDVAQVVRRVEVIGIGRDDVSAYRLLSTIETLWRDGQIGLALVIFAFTLVFPIGKYLALGYVMSGRYDGRRQRVLRWVKNLGQWSMGDVFVVALLVVIVRVDSSFAQISVAPRPGLWVFAGSVLLAMIASAALGFHFDRARRSD